MGWGGLGASSWAGPVLGPRSNVRVAPREQLDQLEWAPGGQEWAAREQSAARGHQGRPSSSKDTEGARAPLMSWRCWKGWDQRATAGQPPVPGCWREPHRTRVCIYPHAAHLCVHRHECPCRVSSAPRAAQPEQGWDEAAAAAVFTVWPSLRGCRWVLTGNTGSAWLLRGGKDVEPQQPLSGCHGAFLSQQQPV